MDLISRFNQSSRRGKLCSAGMQSYEETTTNFDAMVANVTDASDCMQSTYHLTLQMQLESEALAEAGFTDVFSGDGPAGIGLFDKLTDNATAVNFTVSAPRRYNLRRFRI